MTKQRKTPLRTCVACRETGDKRDFIRVVRTPEGHVVIDASGKANGRGAYVCANDECFDAARMRRRLDAALKVDLKDDDYDRLKRELTQTREAILGTQQGR